MRRKNYVASTLALISIRPLQLTAFNAVRRMFQGRRIMRFFKANPAAFLMRLAALAGIFAAATVMASESQEVQNLRAFAKLYGYVKYFHPSDEASRVDWDTFAIYGAKRVKDARDSDELTSVLEELFLPIAPTIQIYDSNEKPKPFVVPEDTAGLTVVAWQHHGMGLGVSSKIYESIRVNRENRIANPDHDLGTVTQGVDATEHRGREIKLMAFVRADVSGAGNRGQVWLRVDRENKQRGFFNNMAVRPTKNDEWQSYEIIGDVADDATQIVFGCFLRGMGQLWVDDFQLSVRNEEGGWEPVRIENPGFEEEANGSPQMWWAESPGYTYELVSDNPHKGQKSLLIENMGQSHSGALFDELPEVGDVVNKELGAGLSCQIPLALYSDHNGTVPEAEEASLDGVLDELDRMEIDKLTADDGSVRLGDIVIAWNVFQHFYPYFDVVGTDWDAVLTRALKEAIADQNEEDFYFTLRKLVARLRDGHGGVYHEMYREQAGFSFLVDWIEGQVVITFLQDDADLQIGDIVVSVDGVPAEQVLLNAEEYISGSPQWKRVKSLRRFGYDKEGTAATLQIMRSGEMLEVEVVRSNKEPLREPTRSTIEEIEDDIFYVNLDKVEMDAIKKEMDDLANAKGVIFDLRGYPKGNHEVISHLLTDPDTSSAWMRVPMIITPDQENVVGFTNHGWHLQPVQPHIKGKVVFITDGRAISYAESFMGLIEHYELAEIVGQPTAGTNGNVNPFELPGGFRITWTGMLVVKHDGSQHHLVGIQPTVPSHRTIQGVIEGRDEYLETALEVIQGD